MSNKKNWGILYILGCSLVVIAGSLWIADPDVFWHLKVGEWIVTNGAVPRTDIYSWSVHGQPWTAHQWLWEALMFVVHKFAGILGLWLLAFLMVFSVGLLIRSGLKSGGVSEEIASAAGGVASLLLIGWLKPWPQAGVYALFAAYLFLSLRDRWGWSETIFAGGMGLVWGNIHSTAFMFPLLLLGESFWTWIFQKENRGNLRWRLTAAITAAIATLLNPHGLGLWAYAIREGLLSSKYRENIFSWRPYVFGFNALAAVIFVSIVILFVAVRQGKEKELAFVRAAGFWVLALMSRIYSPYAILSTAALLGLLTFRLETASLKRLAALSILAAVIIAPLKGLPTELDTVAQKKGYPVNALDFISAQGYEKVFNDHGWGGYLIWKEVPVYIDGRNDVYGEILDNFINLYQTEKPLGDVIDETGAQTILTHVNEAKDLALRESRIWQEVYRDDESVIYVRK